LLHDKEADEVTITNDGATVLSMVHVSHPAAQLVVDLSQSQDTMAGDGTTGVVLLAAALLTQAQKLCAEGTPVRRVVRGYQTACRLACETLEDIHVVLDATDPAALEKVARSALTSKLASPQREHVAKLVIEACLLQGPCHESKALRLPQVILAAGGRLLDSTRISGVVFPRPFVYAGHDLQSKDIASPKVLLLTCEIDFKHLGENLEAKVASPAHHATFADAEWEHFEV